MYIYRYLHIHSKYTYIYVYLHSVFEFMYLDHTVSLYMDIYTVYIWLSPISVPHLSSF